jgi:hypothetical protein
MLMIFVEALAIKVFRNISSFFNIGENHVMINPELFMDQRSVSLKIITSF